MVNIVSEIIIRVECCIRLHSYKITIRYGIVNRIR